MNISDGSYVTFAKQKREGDIESFITTWETTTENEVIMIPTIGAGYDFTIDWGDGTIEINTTGNPSHSYSTP